VSALTRVKRVFILVNAVHKGGKEGKQWGKI